MRPIELTTDDVRALWDAGVTDQGIEDLIFVSVAFSVIDRLADAFKFEATGWLDTISKGAETTLQYGYLTRSLFASKR